MAISTTVLRERLYATILAVVVLLCSAGAYARALEIRGFALTVSDMDRSVEFFERALDFRKVSERTILDRNYDYLTGVFATRVRNVQLKLGDETIELEQYLSPAGQPIPIDSRSNDLWFQHFAVVVSDMEKAFEHIKTFPITGISSAPQTIPESNKGAAGIKAYKFKDPDGHPLELLYFPADKGNPKWQQAKGNLFLGIDHSAITVGSTERSSAFYENFIGLQVKGGGVNTGATQEQLDSAFGAVVRITGLRPERSAGPGLEFLQYLTPSGGRSAPRGSRPNDLVLTRSIVEVDDLRSLMTLLQNNNVTFISPDIVTVTGAPYSQALMVKDPDGHAVLLVQK
jgi:catechol 2,3-dioxygenase-like lactoylglutathione lyase family enzyme